MDYLKVGKILNTKGIKGELKIRSLTDFTSDRFGAGNKIYILYQDKYMPFEVKNFKQASKSDILTLKDHEDINLVEKYKGLDIYVDADDEMTLYDDEYHLSEIIGLDVYQNDQIVGKVIDVLPYPQGDYLKVETLTKKLAMIPFRDEFVLNTDLESGRIDIIDMEGLL